MLVIFRQNTKVIALLFDQKSLIVITFQSGIKINQFQCWSFFGKIASLQPYCLAKNRSFSSLFNLQSNSINFQFGQLSAKHECFSLTVWPTIAHYHHFQSAIKINQFQCWSFFGKIPRVQPYFLANNRSCLYNVSICNQNQSISILVICRQTTKGIALLFGQQSLIFITFQSAIKINQLLVWSVVGKIPRLWPYLLAKNRSFSSLFNLQSKSINLNVGHFSAKYQGYSLTFWPIIAHVCIMFQSAININQCQFWSFVGKLPRVLPYFLANSRSFSSLFNLQSKSINFNIGHLSAKYQSYGLNFGQKSLMFL